MTLIAKIVSLSAVGLLLTGVTAMETATPSDSAPAPAKTQLATGGRETLSVDYLAQRRNAWAMLTRILSPDGDGLDPLVRWHPSGEVFAAPATPTNGSASPKAHMAKLQSGDAEAIIFTLYNDVAYRHVRQRGLYLRSTLEQLRSSGATQSDVSPAIPAFPESSAVVLAVWWPIAKDAITALPVWDPELNPARPSGNGYATWQRVVAVDARPGAEAFAPVRFLDREFPHAPRVTIERFRYLVVDETKARTLMQDSQQRKAAVIALGRQLQAGDYLALVGMHVMAKEHTYWRLATLWWHDRPDIGGFAGERPADLPSPWSNYLLDTPDALAGSTQSSQRVTFNPWLEARFPDQGSGGGMASDCVTCHRRASYPPVAFLPVRRGPPDPKTDPAFAPDQLRTDFLWSVPRQAVASPR